MPYRKPTVRECLFYILEGRKPKLRTHKTSEDDIVWTIGPGDYALINFPALISETPVFCYINSVGRSRANVTLLATPESEKDYDLPIPYGYVAGEDITWPSEHVKAIPAWILGQKKVFAGETKVLRD